MSEEDYSTADYLQDYMQEIQEVDTTVEEINPEPPPPAETSAN